MKIGLIGYGRFGRLAAGYLSKEAEVCVYDVRSLAREHLPRNLSRVTLEEAAGCPVVLLAVPVSALRTTLRKISPHVRARSLIVDVGAVKELPARWMRTELPRGVSLLATHPLFGPDSAGRSLRGRWMVLCPVRISRSRLASVRRQLHRKGVRTVVMSVRGHDRLAAETVLLTQYIGRLVLKAGLRRWPEVTRAYGGVLTLLDIARRDSGDLFRDMVTYSREGRRVMQSLRRASDGIARALEGSRGKSRGNRLR